MISLRKFSSGNFDWPLFVSVILLFCIGLMAIYSVDLSRGGELIFFKKQMVAFGIGMGLFLFAATRQHTFFYTFSKSAYLLSFLLLVAVLIFGHQVRGTTGWFVFSGFSFQPVEFAKVGLILFLGYITASFGRRFEKPIYFFGTGLIALVLIGLVMLQPDLGSAVLLLSIWFGIMLIVGTRKLFLVLFVLSGILISLFSWNFLFEDYQKDRVLTFISPERDPLGAGYNVTQALIAIGSGRFLGRGLGFGSQSQLRFLPEAQTDFIFSVIGEELGFIGIGALLVLFSIVFWRLILIMNKAENDYAMVVVFGVLVLFFSQFLINTGANLGLLPVTGITLPFISYGGSSLMMNFLLLGIVQSMIKKNY